MPGAALWPKVHVYPPKFWLILWIPGYENNSPPLFLSNLGHGASSVFTRGVPFNSGVLFPGRCDHLFLLVLLPDDFSRFWSKELLSFTVFFIDKPCILVAPECVRMEAGKKIMRILLTYQKKTPLVSQSLSSPFALASAGERIYSKGIDFCSWRR